MFAILSFLGWFYSFCGMCVFCGREFVLKYVLSTRIRSQNRYFLEGHPNQVGIKQVTRSSLIINYWESGQLYNQLGNRLKVTNLESGWLYNLIKSLWLNIKREGMLSDQKDQFPSRLYKRGGSPVVYSWVWLTVGHMIHPDSQLVI